MTDTAQSPTSPPTQPPTPTPTPPPAPPSGPPLRQTGVTLARPVLVALLFLATAVAVITAVVGLVLAYIWQSDEATREWELSHYTYLIRTFWVGFVAACALFLVFLIVVVGGTPARGNGASEALYFLSVFGLMAGWLVAGLWTTLRCVLSIVNANAEQPMPRPQTLLF
ncbi:MAG: hypothetical protein AAGH57_09650 [Pseudomonadota bacterium]